MTVQEVDKLLHRIKIHKSNFMNNYNSDEIKELKAIWCDVLWDYDSDKVNIKLDEFLSDINNAAKNITVYSLVEGLPKKTYSDRDIFIRCKICNAKLRTQDYDLHFSRCNSIEYLQKNLKKYSMKVYSRQDLMKLNEKDFEELYWDLLKIFKEKSESTLEKHLISNALKTHYGQAPNLNLSEVVAELSKKK